MSTKLRPHIEIAHPNTTVITACGGLDLGWSSELNGVLSDAIRRGRPNVIIDVRAMDFMVRGLVWILEERSRRLTEYGGGVWIVGAGPRLQAYMNYALPGLELPSFRFVDDEAAAVKEIAARPPR